MRLHEPDSGSMTKKSIADRFLGTLARAHARGVLGRTLRQAEDSIAVQNRVLLEKIRRNQDSDFGRDFGFAQIQSYEDFTERIPVTTYEGLAPYVERVMKGEVGAMFGNKQRVHMFAMTSGTTDEPKYVPVTGAFLAEYRRGWNAFGVKAILDHPNAFLKPILQVTSPMDEHLAPSGVPCGAISGLMAATQKRIVRRFYVTPACVGYIADADARYYTIARLGLARDVGFMVSANPATMLRVARMGDEHAERIVRDVRDGTLTPPGDVPAAIREQLLPRLKPDSKRAAFLAQVISRTGRLLPKDVWNLGFISNWTGGTLGLYLQDFPEYFGDTPIRDPGLLASEGRMSIPLEDGSSAGIIDSASHFFEFLPAEAATDRIPLRSHEVEVGQQYSILLTTSAGFYRYDIGDRVRVVDFHGQAPVIEFLHKGQHVSSLTGEKLTEQHVVLAFGRACRGAGIAARRFVVAPQWATPPFYRLHVECDAIEANCNPSEFVTEMDRQLREGNIEYASKRDSGRLGKLELNLLPTHFLQQIEAEETEKRKGRYEQYKHRYLYNTPGQDSLFPIHPTKSKTVRATG